MSKKVLTLSALLLAAAVVTVYGLVAIRSKSRQPLSYLANHPNSILARPSPNKVRAGALWPQLRAYLKALGNRLEEPGMERLTLAGTFDGAATQRDPFIAISQFPDRLQFTVQLGGQSLTITCVTEAECVATDNLSDAEEGLIHSLINDTAEHFFAVQMNGAPTRHLGDRFRADDGSAENYTGRYYDIFSLTDRITLGSAPHSISKLYYFNSDTHLLERVKYQISRHGETVDVETQFLDWRRIQDQQVATRVVRLENGQQVMSLTVTSATVGPRLNDGIF